MKNSVYVSVVVFLLAFLSNIFFGSVRFDMSEIWSVLMGTSADDTVRYVIVESRLPQALTAMLSGAGLAVSGLLLQTVFHNPLAGPSVLGVTNGASLGVAIVMLLAGGASVVGDVLSGLSGQMLLFLAALAGALLVTALLVFISAVAANHLVLLIAGIMIGYLISSLITLFTYSASETSIQGYVLWGMGDFSLVSLQQIPWLAAAVTLPLIACLPLIKPLNALLLGECYAASLGYSVRSLHIRMLLVVGILCAVITAYCGPVSFLGLAVPHISRFVCRTDDFRTLFPTTIFFGATVAMLCNLACTAFTDHIIPLSAVTPLVGAPVVLYLFFRKR